MDTTLQMKLEEIVLDTFAGMGDSNDSQALLVESTMNSSTHVADKYNDWNATAHQKSPVSTPNMRRKGVVEDFNEDIKTCPFCNDEFTKGNQFSGHLLKCPERKRGRRRRRARKVESEVISCPRALVEQKRSTPGRKLPWG
jgi:hypothetical protein